MTQRGSRLTLVNFKIIYLKMAPKLHLASLRQLPEQQPPPVGAFFPGLAGREGTWIVCAVVWLETNRNSDKDARASARFYF